MNDAINETVLEPTEWLRPHQTDFCHLESRTNLLLAISDAEAMGFEGTRQSLVELLQALEVAYCGIARQDRRQRLER